MSIPEVHVRDLPVDAALLDVREDDEWSAGRIEGAAHIPMRDIPARLTDISREDPVYVVCRSGGRSAQVAEWLNHQGFNAINVAGGMQAWVAAERAMVSDAATPTVL
ncbi:MAG: rhodanese-like domain-containing protein [Actinomycetota bacterium]